MSTPLIDFTDKNGIKLEIYNGTDGIAFFIHKEKEEKGLKIWLSGNQCRKLINRVGSWIEFFGLEDA